MLEATGNVRFTIFANFFDVVGTTNCGGGRSTGGIPGAMKNDEK
jgi:hypothetical protein